MGAAKVTCVGGWIGEGVIAERERREIGDGGRREIGEGGRKRYKRAKNARHVSSGVGAGGTGRGGGRRWLVAGGLVDSPPRPRK